MRDVIFGDHLLYEFKLDREKVEVSRPENDEELFLWEPPSPTIDTLQFSSKNFTHKPVTTRPSGATLVDFSCVIGKSLR